MAKKKFSVPSSPIKLEPMEKVENKMADMAKT